MAADSWMPYEVLLDELKRGELELEHKKLFLREASEKAQIIKANIEQQKSRRHEIMNAVFDIEGKTMDLSSQIIDAERKLHLFNCEVQRLEDLEYQIHLKKIGKQKEIVVLNDSLYKVGHDFAAQTLYKSCEITSKSQPLEFIVEKHLKGKQEVTDAVEKAKIDCENLRKEIDSFIIEKKTDYDQTRRLFDSIYETLDEIDACVEQSFHSQPTELTKDKSNLNGPQTGETFLAETGSNKTSKPCEKPRNLTEEKCANFHRVSAQSKPTKPKLSLYNGLSQKQVANILGKEITCPKKIDSPVQTKISNFFPHIEMRSFSNRARTNTPAKPEVESSFFRMTKLADDYEEDNFGEDW